MGGPLGKTKRIAESGIEDVSDEMGAFENHPHFPIFPGEAVEIMPVPGN